ncbi:MAG TPA: DnaD domain protein [Ligilactobacillus acidipiscis]|uniref:DnaD domain protein n=1 Tax=Ligilactobacillus acidipiscis TaxID=89059 RepID=A0A921K028_9LACO|nr:DnaD domain protein [Ligilactobacillus acidipiscis]
MSSEEQPSYFSILTANVRYDPRLKNHADEKVLFSEITALANKQGYCHASNSYFAKLYDRPVPTISKWISHLTELGYLTNILIRDGKQIKERRLFPNTTPINANDNTYSREHEGGINADVKGGINVNVKDNNTSINNTRITSSSRAAEKTAEETTENPKPKTQHSTENDPWDLWEKNWGFPNSIAQQDLMEWCQRFGNDLVYHAVEYALKSNVTAKGADRYLARVFDSYEKKQIITVTQAIEQEEQHYQQKTREFANKRQYGGKYQARQKEQLPDWAKDDHDTADQSDDEQPSPEILKKRADIERRLKESGLKK